MKRLTLNQYRVLSSASPTTHINAARQLADLGLIEITGKVWSGHRQHYKPRLAVTFTVTERGREEMAYSRQGTIRQVKDWSRNKNAYERRQRGDSYVEIGRSLGICASSVRSLVSTWRRHAAERNNANDLH